MKEAETRKTNAKARFANLSKPAARKYLRSLLACETSAVAHVLYQGLGRIGKLWTHLRF
jgi:hypothetical protein